MAFLQVRYDDVDSLVRVLEDNGIDTVISALTMESEAGSKSQLNLIAAADRSSATQRFIPSEYMIDVAENAGDSIFAELGAKFLLENAAALKNTKLEYTRIFNGMFVDYWGMPHVHTFLVPFHYGIDMSLRKAVVPGSGNDVFSLTYSIDVARFIVRLLDEKDWPKKASVCGSDLTFNEFVAAAEKARGSNFEVVYDDAEKLNQGQATFPTPLNASNEIYAQMAPSLGLMITTGALRLPLEGRLNDRFPEIHAATVEELLTQAWAGK
ncbi:Oxidoreductase swnN [Colletotrichum trifolii]|uniref:Oxidoreductase swnN n=1 Tax=Colletotrichum trifolii TaxID=5466 RepID=A0A4R8QSB5_COLTR|nr:Oxidoreductase swnN [Colletotrichum trifolii]